MNLIMPDYLIIKPSSLGDIIHGLQVVASLKAQQPDATIRWVVRDTFAAIVQACPVVDEVLLFQRKGGVSAFLRLCKQIRQQRYDYVLDMQGLARSGLLTGAAQATHKLGRPDAREGASFFYHKVIPMPPAGEQAHAVAKLLEFLPAIGLEKTLAAPVQFNSEEKPQQPGFDTSEKPLLLFPESRRPEKEWQYFPQLTEALLREDSLDAPICWVGAKKQPTPAALNPAEENRRFFNLTGQTTLPQVVALIQQARLCVCNDSGPMHIAAAVGTPVLALFGPTPPERYGPYPQERETNHVITATDGAMDSIKPETVIEKIHSVCN